MARIKYFDETDNAWKYADNVLVAAPVTSVNGKTGDVHVAAEDVGAEASGSVSAHNQNAAAHADIRRLISSLEGKTILKSDLSIKKAQLTLEDGSTILIDVVVASDGTAIQKYTNLIPTSIDTDGSVYNGIGYKEGYRLNSSGTEKAIDSFECTNGSIITGFIPVSPGDVVRIYGIPWYRSDPNGNSDGSANYFAGYDANFTYIGAAIGNLSYFYGQWENTPPAYNVTVADGDLTSELITFTLPSNSNVKYIRMSCCSGKSNLLTDPASAVITVNEEIK